MKKIYTIIAILFLFAGANAQTSESRALSSKHLTPFTGQKNYNHSPNHEKSGPAAFWIDLDSADSFNAASLGLNYARFRWDNNFHYVNADTLGGHFGLSNYYMVMFDTLVDSYNAAGPFPYSRSAYPTLSVDSVLLWVGQENNSGNDDTLIVQILGVQHHATGLATYPDTAGTIMYSNDMFILPASAPLNTGNYGDGFFFVYHPSSPNLPTNTFTIKVQYLGAKTDSFMFVAGCPAFSGAGACAGFTMADSSSYHPNSFYKETQTSTNFKEDRVWPTPGDGYLYYECNSVTGFTYGVDGFDYIQNIGVNAKVTITTGMTENKSLGIKLFQNMPNPFTNTSNVTYELAKHGNVTFEVTDLAGRVIVAMNEGGQDAGRHTITLDGKNFSQGVYFYTVNVDGVKLSNKMIVTK